MRLAVFSDLHGNLPALEAFNQEARGYDGYICLGDVVNYGPWSDECLELLHTFPNLLFVEGNHERLFLGTEDATQEHPLVQRFIEHTLPNFRRFDLISNLPERETIGEFTFIHTINHKRIFWDTPIDIDRNYFIGHTHHAFDVERSGYRIVNCGSLGQDRRHIERCNYAVIDLEDKTTKLKWFEHDINLVINEMISRRYPAECVDYYKLKLKP